MPRDTRAATPPSPTVASLFHSLCRNPKKCQFSALCFQSLPRSFSLLPKQVLCLHILNKNTPGYTHSSHPTSQPLLEVRPKMERAPPLSPPFDPFPDPVLQFLV